VKTEKKYCCQRGLYGVKRNIAANKAHFWDYCINVGHFLCGVARVNVMWTSICICIVSSLKWTSKMSTLTTLEKYLQIPMLVLFVFTI